MLVATMAVGQSVTVMFTGKNQNGDYHEFTRIYVQNRTRGWSQELIYPDTVLVLNTSQGIASADYEEIGLHEFSPNPSKGNTSALLDLPYSCDVSISLVSLKGEILATQRQILPAGTLKICLNLQKSGVAFLVVCSGDHRWVKKIVSLGGGGNNTITIEYAEKYKRLAKAEAVGEFQLGDEMLYKAFDTSTTPSMPEVRVQVEDELVELVFFEETEAFDEYGATKSVFSVGEEASVRFSRGNLQFSAQGTHLVATGQVVDGTWRFAEHQWGMIGEGNANISQTYEGWIDLFGWGTSGWNNGELYYQPWDTSGFSNHYVGGDSEVDLVGGYAYADWGVYNAIWGGGGQPGMWRALTFDEWEYLLFSRTNSTACGFENVRFHKATVAGVAGLIVFPDNYEHPEEVEPLNHVNSVVAAFDGYELNESAWDYMELAGCVFLPAAGVRFRAQVHLDNYGHPYGSYFSSNSGPVPSHAASLVIFMDTFEDYDPTRGVEIGWNLRGLGQSVRLVRTVKGKCPKD